MFFSLFSQLCFLRHFYQNWVRSLPLVVVSMFVRLEWYDPDWWRYFLETWCWWCWSRFWCGFLWLCRRARLSLEEMNESLPFTLVHKGFTFRLMFFNLELTHRPKIMFSKHVCYDFSTVAINAVEKSVLSQGSPILKCGPCIWALTPTSHPHISHIPYFCLSDGRHDISNKNIRSAFFQKWVYASNIQFWGSWKGNVACLFFCFPCFPSFPCSPIRDCRISQFEEPSHNILIGPLTLMTGYVCISSTTINDIKGAEITIMLLTWSSQKVFFVSFYFWLFSFKNICLKFYRTYLSSCPKQKYLPFLVPAWPPLDMKGWWKVDIRGYQEIWIDWQIWLIISGWRNRSGKNQR